MMQILGRFYDVDLGPIKFTRKKANSDPKNVHVLMEDIEETVQQQSDLLYKAIIPYRPVGYPLIDEIDEQIY